MVSNFCKPILNPHLCYPLKTLLQSVAWKKPFFMIIFNHKISMVLSVLGPTCPTYSFFSFFFATAHIGSWNKLLTMLKPASRRSCQSFVRKSWTSRSWTSFPVIVILRLLTTSCFKLAGAEAALTMNQRVGVETLRKHKATYHIARGIEARQAPPPASTPPGSLTANSLVGCRRPNHPMAPRLREIERPLDSLWVEWE